MTRSFIRNQSSNKKMDYKGTISGIIYTVLLTLLLCLLFTQKVSAASPAIALNSSKQTISKGSYYQLELKWIGKNDTVTWSTSSKKVATVTKEGMVYGKSAGKATITAKCNGKKYKCTVTVSKNSDITYETGSIIESGGWVYYLDYDSIDSHEAVAGGYICKMKKDGSSKKVLCKDTCSDITVVGDNIYYIKHSSKDWYMTSHDRVLNRIKTDGSEKKTIITYEKKVERYLISGNYIYMLESGSIYRVGIKNLKGELLFGYATANTLELIQGRLFYTQQINDYNSVGVKLPGSYSLNSAILLQSINTDGSGQKSYGLASDGGLDNVIFYDGMIYYSNGDGYLVRRKIDGTGNVEKITKASWRIALYDGYIYAYDESKHNVTRTNIKTLDTENIIEKASFYDGIDTVYNNVIYGGRRKYCAAFAYNGKTWEQLSGTTIAANISYSKQKALPNKLVNAAITRVTSTKSDANLDVWTPINNVGIGVMCVWAGKDSVKEYIVNEDLPEHKPTLQILGKAPDAYTVWKSSNTKVATVDKDGVLTCKAPGTTVITLTYNKNYTVSTTIKVLDRGFDQEVYEVEVGGTVNVKTCAFTEDKMSAFTIKNTGIAKLTDSNFVTGIKAGTTTITCKSEATGKTYTATIKVTAKKSRGTTVEETLANSKNKEIKLDEWGLMFADVTAFVNAETGNTCLGIKDFVLNAGQSAVADSEETCYTAIVADPSVSGTRDADYVRRITLYWGKYKCNFYLTVADGAPAEGGRVIWAEETKDNSQSFGFSLRYDSKGKYIGTVIWTTNGYYVKVVDGELRLTNVKDDAALFKTYSIDVWSID